MSLDDFRVPAKSLVQARARFAKIREEHDELRERAKVLDERIGAEWSKRNVESLSDALEKTGEMVNQLRRRQAVGNRLAEMVQYRKELDRVNAFLVQHQAIPAWMLVGIYAVIAIGVGFVALAASQPAYLMLGVLGAVCAVGAIGGKIAIEKNNAKKLQHNQRQLTLLLAQLEQAKKEAEAIDDRFPGDGKPVETRLQNAQQELTVIEKLLPVETRWKETNQQYKAVLGPYEKAKTALAEANRRWTLWLRRAGLPADWTPAQIRDMIGRYDSVGALRRELDHRYESMNQRIRDMRVITDRIDRMVAETGLVFPDGLSYVDILDQVRRLLVRNDEAIAQRATIREEIKKLRIERRKQASALDQVGRRLEMLLNRFNVASGAELRRLYRHHQEYRERCEQLEAVDRELTAGVGGFCQDTQIAAIIEPLIVPEHRDELPGKLLLVKKRLDLTSFKHQSELENRGRLDEQLKRLAEDRTILRKQRELAVVEDKLKTTVRRWQTFAVMTFLLDSIRRTYERERQPQTLFEASELLRELTDGRYVRIWTPMGEETLYVDDDKGNTLDVGWLSRGTREQLFIAIRIALTSAFLKHGTVLPLILDDVLVNFDTKRAVAAARMLQRVAAGGRQVFLFTCHEHICRIFQRLDTPVRILPHADSENKKIRILLPISLLRKRRAARRKAQRRARQNRRSVVDETILLVQRQATAEKAAEKTVPPPTPPESVDPPK